MALLVGSASVWTSSYSAFTATTTDPANTWATGSVAISDNDGGVSAMFPIGAAANTGLHPDTLTGMALTNTGGPGQVAVNGTRGSACIKVLYTGSVNANVRLWGTLTDAAVLGPDILFSIDTVTATLGAGADPLCAAFPTTATNIFGGLSNSTVKMSPFPASYSASALTWAATSNSYLWYRFNWMLPYTGGDTAQAAIRTVILDLTWEAHSS